MTLDDALQKINDFSYLIGTDRDGMSIDELIIVPSTGENQGEIIAKVHMEEPYDIYLIGHNDFCILALLDLHDYSNTGVVFTENLDRIVEIN
jgi:hypothetical protein